jgi:hypothetical protein
MKKSLFIGLLLVVVSCKERPKITVKNLSENDQTKNIIVGDQTDKKGCLTSAGYIHSVIKNDCVRLFDIGIQLYPKSNPTTEDAVLVAYLILSDDTFEAEVFLPSQEASVIFLRTEEGQPWIYQDWQLIANEGYVLKKNDEILYAGDGEFGPKVTGSDKREE